MPVSEFEITPEMLEIAKAAQRANVTPTNLCRIYGHEIDTDTPPGAPIICDRCGQWLE